MEINFAYKNTKRCFDQYVKGNNWVSFRKRQNAQVKVHLVKAVKMLNFRGYIIFHMSLHENNISKRKYVYM